MIFWIDHIEGDGVLETEFENFWGFCNDEHDRLGFIYVGY